MNNKETVADLPTTYVTGQMYTLFCLLQCRLFPAGSRFCTTPFSWRCDKKKRPVVARICLLSLGLSFSGVDFLGLGGCALSDKLSCENQLAGLVKSCPAEGT